MKKKMYFWGILVLVFSQIFCEDVISFQKLDAEEKEPRGFLPKNNLHFQPYRKFTICFGARCLNEKEFRSFVKSQQEMELRKDQRLKMLRKAKSSKILENYKILREFNGMRNF
jgi:hypothetical protein